MLCVATIEPCLTDAEGGFSGWMPNEDDSVKLTHMNLPLHRDYHWPGCCLQCVRGGLEGRQQQPAASGLWAARISHSLGGRAGACQCTTVVPLAAAGCEPSTLSIPTILQRCEIALPRRLHPFGAGHNMALPSDEQEPVYSRAMPGCCTCAFPRVPHKAVTQPTALTIRA